MRVQQTEREPQILGDMREFLSGCAAAAGRRYRSCLVRSAAAAAFLRAHRGHVRLITIDIGANNPEDCGSRPDLAALASCVGQVPGTTTR
jgi:hypothetical protein